MKLIAVGSLTAAVLLASCSAAPPARISASRQAAIQQEADAQRAQDEVGIYHPTHWTRKRLANMIGQMMDDPTLATISYAQGIDGRLRCIGHTIGFPLPGGTQTTSPHKWDKRPGWRGDSYDYYEQVDQPEPDQLFYPSSAEGTFIMLVSSRGVAKPAYFEGHVQTFAADDKPDPSLIAQDCTH